LLSWVFGAVETSTVHLNQSDCAAGILQLQNARVRWFLSINAEHLPEAQQAKGQRTYRSITVNGQEVEFSEGFTDLHTLSYQHILAGHGFGLADARAAVEMVHQLRNAPLAALSGDCHPFTCQVARPERR
jgi:UDP-N-acetyl-2-amino-2-deoxyglucuronate dehydrogenase